MDRFDVGQDEVIRTGAWWHGSWAMFRDTPAETIVARLNLQAVEWFRSNEIAQLRAWHDEIVLLRAALAQVAAPERWHVVFEFTPPRMRRRADVILLHPNGVVVLEFKIGAAGYNTADRLQADDLALDLQDFHAGSRGLPIIPVLVATEAPSASFELPLVCPGAAPKVLCANRHNLSALLQDLDAVLARAGVIVDLPRWLAGGYLAMPGIIDAACTLYSRHNVADIQSARADAENLTLTTDTITRVLDAARQSGEKIVLFVTGIPGAGKTLCGLNAAFAVGSETTFLTGNPTLVHVLREALARSQAEGSGGLRTARQKMKGIIQALPAFRDLYAGTTDTPPERVVVIDEAQRSWTEGYAIRKSADRSVPLTRSEPAHLLDAMARHDGFAAVICLIGNGQEIHDGEGGLAEWSLALANRPEWRIGCAAPALNDPEPRQRLARLPGLEVLPGLHLTVAVRALRNGAVPQWVDAVLCGDVAAARAIAAQGRLPFRLTRRLEDLRRGLRHLAGEGQRTGLVAAASAKRLRAEGLGVELPHMDDKAVAQWFLDWFPDIRASDALETVATQFSVQGLELDYVGLCWDGDLIRRPGVAGWQARSLNGTKWQVVGSAERLANRLNTYRVLLTRARYETLIWVPEGDASDLTRDPAMLDGVAAFLLECGVSTLELPAVGPARDVSQLVLGDL